MATRLTQAAATAKQFGLVVAVLIPTLILFRIGWGIASDALKPKPTPTPIFTNTLYQVLPKLPISENIPRSSAAKIVLSTADLQVPRVSYLQPTAPVYTYKKRTTTFDYINNVNAITKIFGITSGNTIQLAPNLFRISESNPDGKQLDIDIQYYNLKFSFQNAAPYIPIEQGSTVIETAAVASANNLLNQLMVYLEYSKSETATTRLPEANYFYQSLDGNIRKVSNQSQANITSVKLFRPELQNVPFISESVEQPNLYLKYTEERASVTSAGANRPRLLSADITYWPISESSLASPATYPLKTVQQAYQEIESGKGYVVSNLDPNSTYQILSAYLAYYEPKSYSEYTIPVWVFEGDTVKDPNTLFRVIVPAIATGYITE